MLPFKASRMGQNTEQQLVKSTVENFGAPIIANILQSLQKFDFFHSDGSSYATLWALRVVNNYSNMQNRITQFAVDVGNSVL